MADKTVNFFGPDGGVPVEFADQGDGSFAMPVEVTGGAVTVDAGSAVIGKVGIDQTAGQNVVVSGAGEAHLGQVGGHTPRVTAAYARPADNTAYQAGDIIGNSGTAASVVPLEFTVARIAGGSGRLTGCRCVVTAASGTIVIANLAFDLLLFRPESSIPFAAAGYPADNAALNISSAAMKELVAIFSFSASAWRNQAGGLTAAGLNVYQAVALASGRMYAPFNLASLPSSQKLLGLLQIQGAWTPTGIINTFDFALDCDQD